MEMLTFIQRICNAIRRILQKQSQFVCFNRLDARQNIAGLLSEQRKRSEEGEGIIRSSTNRTTLATN
jgi:hypothetical protein